MAKGKYQEWLEPEGLLKLESWARNGLTDKQIAHNIGISEQTLNNWKKAYPSFLETLKRGKEVIDIEVENALLKRALGYSCSEEKYISVPMDTAEYYEKLDEYMNQYKIDHPEATATDLIIAREMFPKTKEILAERKVKEVVPDTTAQIFWLKNRKPAEWRDRQNVELSGGMEINNPYKDLTTEELKKLIRDG